MRVDLQNHTFSPQAFSRLKKTVEDKSGQEIYTQAIKYHHLDAIAITNYHNIDVGLSLSREYPRHVIVGAEYRVYGEEGSSIQVIALGIHEELHKALMKARLRGVAYFTSLLKEKHIPYYMAHIGSGIPLNHPTAPELLDSVLQHFSAIEVLNGSLWEKINFAANLARYYNLATMGGSGYCVTKTERRAYTEADAHSVEEFLEAIAQKRVKVGLTSGHAAPKTGFMGETGQDFYPGILQKIWHSEFGLGQQSNLGNLLKRWGQAMLPTALQWVTQISHSHQLKEEQQTLALFQKKFVDYLMLQETRRIFSLSLSLEAKKNLWEQAIGKIHECFR
jgi:hypothetical protein